MSDRSTEERVRAAFGDQARSCAALGSPFTAWLCERFAQTLTREDPVGERVLTWPGDPSTGGDNVPLRLCGAVHALALSGRSEALAAHLSVAVPSIAAWDSIADALHRHADEVLTVLESPPQTNEVGRSAAIYPAFGVVGARTGLALSLLEVGASAGLNLLCDRFAYTLGRWRGGDPGSAVKLAPEWRGEDVSGPEPTIAARAGCDLRPFDVTDPAARLRLISYVWPDQQARLERARAALEIASREPPLVAAADALDWLPKKLADPAVGIARVVFSTVAWQYLSAPARAAGQKIIETAGRAATAASPLAWVKLEGDGAGPGAAVTLKLWNGSGSARHFDLGRADYHGRWMAWRAPPSD